MITNIIGGLLVFGYLMLWCGLYDYHRQGKVAKGK